MELLVYALQKILHIKTFMGPILTGLSYGDMLSHIGDRCLSEKNDGRKVGQVKDCSFGKPRAILCLLIIAVGVQGVRGGFVRNEILVVGAKGDA